MLVRGIVCENPEPRRGQMGNGIGSGLEGKERGSREKGGGTSESPLVSNLLREGRGQKELLGGGGMFFVEGKSFRQRGKREL